MDWELVGEAWREGTHGGTLVGSRGLELIPGVSRGVYRRVLIGAEPCDRFVASLNPEPFPVGAGLRLSLRLREGEGWSPWAPLGVIGSGRDLPRSESCAGGNLKVSEDLLQTSAPSAEVELRLEVEAGEMGGSPVLRRLTLVGWRADEPLGAPEEPLREAWGVTLELPERSQRALAPELVERACSPTSLSMLLAFHGRDLEPAEVARRVHDAGAKIYGNWSFNVALAGELGLRAAVRRWRDLRRIEEEIAAGRPLVISHRYEEGELSDTPLARTSGHLIAVVGFSETGDLVVHDPAADPARGEAVRRVYRRDEVRRTWLEKGSGIAYQVMAEEALP